MSILSILKVLLTAENTEFKKEMQESRKVTSDFKKEILQSGAQLLTGAAAIGLVTKGLSAMIREAGEAERVDARLNAVLKSTGGAAGLTADELDRLATNTSRLTGVDDELIKSAETVLLTFTQIGKDVFPSAIMAAADMSEIMGQDLQSSIVQLGKALNDPIEGITALRRVGVSFTDAQQEQIKTLVESGDVLTAQKLILKELQVEFGGAAEAAGKTFTGSLDKARQATLDLAIAGGQKLLPVMQQAVDLYTKMVNAQTDTALGQEKYNEALDKGVISEEEMIEALEKFRWEGLGSAEAQEFLNDKTEEYNAWLEEIGQRTHPTYAEMMEQSKKNTDEAAVSTDILGNALAGLAGDYDAAKTSAGLMSAALKAITDDMLEQERIKLVLKLATLDIDKNATQAEKEKNTAMITDLLNQQTTLENLDKLNDALEADIITKYDWISVMSDGIITQQEMNNLLGESVGELALIKDGVVNLPEYKKFTYEVEVVGDAIPSLSLKGGAIAQQHGGDWLVNEPTLFLAGEAGPERAIFIPKGQDAKVGGMTFYQTFNMTAGDPRAVKRAACEGILEAARARGLA